MDDRQLSHYAFRIAIVAALGGFLFGYDISIISGALIFLKTEFHLDEIQQGFAVSSAAIGCIAGPLVAVALSDAIGRRRTLTVAAVLLPVSAIGTALPRDMMQFNLFRIIGGAGVGLASVVSPMYIAEMAPARLRGRLVSVNQLAIVIGLFSAIVVSYALSFSGSWRWMFASTCIPALGWMAGLIVLPESPRWLVTRHRDTEAMQLLERTEGQAQARVALAEIKHSISEETGGWAELFRPGLRVALPNYSAYAGLDTVIAFAGMVANEPFLKIEKSNWDKTLRVNLTGSMLLAQAGARLMMRNRRNEAGQRGSVIFTGSWVQSMPWPEGASYCASKAGQEMLAKVMAQELAPHGITCNIVAPGIVYAGLSKKIYDRDKVFQNRVNRTIPLGRLSSAEEIAGTFVHLASADGAYITGTTILIDGGASLVRRDAE